MTEGVFWIEEFGRRKCLSNPVHRAGRVLVEKCVECLRWDSVQQEEGSPPLPSSGYPGHGRTGGKGGQMELAAQPR